jgi:hypothetical protein
VVTVFCPPISVTLLTFERVTRKLARGAEKVTDGITLLAIVRYDIHHKNKNNQTKKR